MEPADLNSRAPDDAQLERLLRHAAPPLTDDGFSARVVAALPASQPAPREWLRPALCLGGALAGVAIVWSQMESVGALRSETTQLLMHAANVSTAVLDPMVGLALLVTLGSLAFAFRPRWLSAAGL